MSAIGAERIFSICEGLELPVYRSNHPVETEFAELVRSHDRVAFPLPFVPLVFRAPRALNWPEKPKSLGEHLRKRRGELGALSEELSAAITPFIADAPTAQVRKAFGTRCLSLVLGAGASAGLGLPGWDGLVDDVTSDIYRQIDSAIDISPISVLRQKQQTTNTTIIRHLENLVGFKSSVMHLVRERLYEKFDEDGAKALIRPMCELFLAPSLLTPVEHVITYNFDNTLERQLRTFRPDVYPIYCADTYPQREPGVRIYHPHGFLPHKDDDPDGTMCGGMVFSERDYNLHFMDPGHWANVVQLYHFMNRTCLFIGISMLDPNMRRLADHAHVRIKDAPRHVSIQRTKGNSLADAYVERDLASLGIQVLWVKEYDDIPTALARCVR
jgi:hypothetical protein